MNLYPIATGYLQKGSGISWADCLLQDPQPNEEYGEFDNLYLGKRYWIGHGPTQNWRAWQSFYRFVALAKRPAAATLRLYVNIDESAPDLTLRLYLLDATYGSLDGSDWNAAGTTYGDISSANIQATPQGQKYLEWTFTAGMLAALPTSGAFDLRIACADQTAAPTTDQYLRVFAVGFEDPAVRPVLIIPITDRRAEILDAVEAALAGIAEPNGYNTTPVGIHRVWEAPINLPASQFPLIQIFPRPETRDAGTIAADMGRWQVIVGAWVYTPDRDARLTALNALGCDIRRALESTIGGSPWGLDYIHSANSRCIATSTDPADCTNLGVTVFDLEIEYERPAGGTL
jgi:hypothetical protein